MQKLGWIDKLEVAITFQHVTLENVIPSGFLLYAGKSDSNKLEQDVYQQLLDPDMLSWLKADALMLLQPCYAGKI